jgi:PKD repeat protein
MILYLVDIQQLPALPSAGNSTGKPVAYITASAPYEVNKPINFSGAMSYAVPGAKIISYKWDFGDGITGTGPTIIHNYTSATEYTVTLTVTDDLGQNDIKSLSVDVKSSFNFLTDPLYSYVGSTFVALGPTSGIGWLAGLIAKKVGNKNKEKNPPTKDGGTDQTIILQTEVNKMKISKRKVLTVTSAGLVSFALILGTVLGIKVAPNYFVLLIAIIAIVLSLFIAFVVSGLNKERYVKNRIVPLREKFEEEIKDIQRDVNSKENKEKISKLTEYVQDTTSVMNIVMDNMKQVSDGYISLSASRFISPDDIKQTLTLISRANIFLHSSNPFIFGILMSTKKRS